MGKLHIKDDVLVLDFDGKVDFESEIPEFDFVAGVHHADLFKLDLLHRDSSLTLSSQLAVKFKGIDPDNIKGTISITQTSYVENNIEYYMDSLILVSFADTGLKKNII